LSSKYVNIGIHADQEIGNNRSRKKSSRQTEERTIEANRVTAAVDGQLFSAISVTL
jgi:hypothetical protein